MDVKLWQELDDQQAEKSCGGQGIGQALSGLVHEGQSLADNFGYQNLNKALRDGAIYGPAGRGATQGQNVAVFTAYANLLLKS